MIALICCASLSIATERCVLVIGCAIIDKFHFRIPILAIAMLNL